MNEAFHPSMNQPQSRVKMLREIESWATYLPDWAWRSFAWLRPIIRRGGTMKPEEEEKLFRIWKSADYWKNKKKQIPPPDEDRPDNRNQKPVKSWVKD